MLLSLVACNRNDAEQGLDTEQELAEFKATALAEIDAYAEGKGQGNYTEEDWLEILDYLANGKANIDAATNNADIEVAKVVAKTSIDAVKKEARKGMFYTLQEAFDNGWLTQYERQSILYYAFETSVHKSLEYYFVFGGSDKDFVPIPKSPNKLTEEMIMIINESQEEYLREHPTMPIFDASVKDKNVIPSYYGVYNDFIAMRLYDNDYYVATPEQKINPNPILVWKLDSVVTAVKEAISNIEKKEVEMDEVLKLFDSTEPKEIWTGSIDDDFADNFVVLVLRKTTMYPELSLSHFGLENAESLAYSFGPRPPDAYFEIGNEEMLANYHQRIYIYLKQCGKEKVVEAIRHLEKLEFVMYAGASGFTPIPGFMNPIFKEI
jgi:hypothetical protein